MNDNVVLHKTECMYFCKFLSVRIALGREGEQRHMTSNGRKELGAFLRTGMEMGLK